MKEIKLTQGKVALVDDEDFEYLNQWKWRHFSSSGNSYAIGQDNKKTTLMHRLIINAPKGKCVDHINGNGLDNRRCNLRLCNHSENQKNKKMHKNNTSGFKGIEYFPRQKQWRARVMFLGKRLSVGYFNSPQDAAKAYDEKSVELFGEFAKTNKMLGLL